MQGGDGGAALKAFLVTEEGWEFDGNGERHLRKQAREEEVSCLVVHTGAANGTQPTN